MGRGLSVIQKEILAYLGDGEKEIYDVSWAIAKKMSIDTSGTHMTWSGAGPGATLIPKSCIHHSTYYEGTHLIRNRKYRGKYGFLKDKFRASFSRSLKRLQDRGLIERNGKIISLKK